MKPLEKNLNELGHVFLNATYSTVTFRRSSREGLDSEQKESFEKAFEKLNLILDFLDFEGTEEDFEDFLYANFSYPFTSDKEGNKFKFRLISLNEAVDIEKLERTKMLVKNLTDGSPCSSKQLVFVQEMMIFLTKHLVSGSDWLVHKTLNGEELFSKRD